MAEVSASAVFDEDGFTELAAAGVVCAEVSGVVTGAKAVVVTISPVVSDLVEEAESSEVV